MVPNTYSAVLPLYSSGVIVTPLSCQNFMLVWYKMYPIVLHDSIWRLLDIFGTYSIIQYCKGPITALLIERHFSLETSHGEHYRGITINDNDRPITFSPETS